MESEDPNKQEILVFDFLPWDFFRISIIMLLQQYDSLFPWSLQSINTKSLALLEACEN